MPHIVRGVCNCNGFNNTAAPATGNDGTGPRSKALGVVSFGWRNGMLLFSLGYLGFLDVMLFVTVVQLLGGAGGGGWMPDCFERIPSSVKRDTGLTLCIVAAGMARVGVAVGAVFAAVAAARAGGEPAPDGLKVRAPPFAFSFARTNTP